MAQSKKYTIQHRISGIVFSLLKCKLHPCIFFVYCLELELPGGLYGNIEHFHHLACLQIFYPVLLACSGKISKRHCNLPSKILLRNLISSRNQAFCKQASKSHVNIDHHHFFSLMETLYALIF